MPQYYPKDMIDQMLATGCIPVQQIDHILINPDKNWTYGFTWYGRSTDPEFYKLQWDANPGYLTVQGTFQVRDDSYYGGRLFGTGIIEAEGGMYVGVGLVPASLFVGGDAAIDGDLNVGGTIYGTVTNPVGIVGSGDVISSWSTPDGMVMSLDSSGNLNLYYNKLIHAGVVDVATVEPAYTGGLPDGYLWYNPTGSGLFRVWDSGAGDWGAIGGGGASVTDHGALTGLSDDDHTIYLPTRRANPELGFNKIYDTSYSEISYSGGLTSAIDIWDTSGKAVKLFSKVVLYATGIVSSVATTDEISGLTLTKTLSYDASGNISNITTGLA